MENKRKRVAVIGTPGRVSNSYRLDTKDVFQRTGLNTGNLVFQHALSTFITDTKEYFGWDVDPKRLRENFDVLVFPAANQLYQPWDMGHLSRVFEESELPLVVIGLGAQAQHRSEDLKFKPGTLRFMKVLSERCTDIGVRGEFTASVLEKHGVKNIQITGCPSNFINPRKDLGRLMRKKLDDIEKSDRIVINIDAAKKLAKLLPVFMGWCERYDAQFVCQDPEFFVKLGRGVDFSAEDLGSLAKLFFRSGVTEEVTHFVRSRLITFFDVATWIEYLRRFDFSVGTKLHGNLLAWQAEVPALFLPHDARVSELIQTMQLPFAELSILERGNSLEWLKLNHKFDADLYDSTRPVLGRRLVDILNSTGLHVLPDLQQFASE